MSNGFPQTKLIILLQASFPFPTDSRFPFLPTHLLSVNLLFPFPFLPGDSFPAHSSGPQDSCHVTVPVTQAFNIWDICAKTEEGKKPQISWYGVNVRWLCFHLWTGWAEEGGIWLKASSLLLVLPVYLYIYLYFSCEDKHDSKRQKIALAEAVRSARNKNPNPFWHSSFKNDTSCTFERTSLDKNFPFSPWQKVNICI